jgi:hypothetical protein
MKNRRKQKKSEEIRRNQKKSKEIEEIGRTKRN